MSTSLSVRGETCSRISQTSNRRVSSVVFWSLVSIFPVPSIFKYIIDRNVFTSYFRVDGCKYGVQVFSQSEFSCIWYFYKNTPMSQTFTFTWVYYMTCLDFFLDFFFSFWNIPPNYYVSLHVQWMLMEQKTNIITQTALFGNAEKCLWRTNQEVTKIEIY